MENSLSSKQMADRIGVKPSDYSKIEKGNKKCWYKHLSKIAKVLGTDKNKLCLDQKEVAMINSIKNEDIAKIINKQQNLYIELFRQLDEIDK